MRSTIEFIQNHLCWLMLFTATVICNTLSGQQQKIDSLWLKYEMNGNVATLNECVGLLMFTDPNLAWERGKAALVAGQESNELNNKIKSLRHMVEIGLKLNKVEKALEYSIEIGRIANNTGSSYAEATFNFSDGIIHFHLHDYSTASKRLFNALKEYQSSKHGTESCKTLKFIGRVYFNQKQYDKAYEYYNLALNCSRKIGYQMGVSAGINNVAAVLETKGEYVTAMAYFNEALAINKKLKNDYWMAINHLNLGIINSQLNNHSVSKENFNSCISLADKFRYFRLHAAGLKGLGAMYYEAGDLDSALDLTVFTTEDGGETWTDIPFSLGDIGCFRGLQMVNETTGYAVLNEGHFYQQRFLRTTDGGVTWTQHEYPHPGEINDLFFINEMEGWVVGGNWCEEVCYVSANIFHTTDGGLTWEIEHDVLGDGEIRRITNFGDRLIAAGFKGNTSNAAVYTSDFTVSTSTNKIDNQATFAEAYMINKDQLNVNWSEEMIGQKMKIEWINILGQQIKTEQKNINEVHSLLDAPENADGINFVILSTKNVQQTIKVLCLN